ncbi:MAG: hypothetical protein HND50_04045 [Calditrichaeota bacterium]|nr:hypothetical protein [Calditrichota bacterium]
MKQKINLTINDQLIHRTKKFTRKQGISVSQFIENLLYKAIDEKEESFTDKWQGKLKSAIKDENDPRFKKLKERYL